MKNFASLLLVGTVLMAGPAMATKESYTMITANQVSCQSAQALLAESGQMVVQTYSLFGHPLRYAVTLKRTCPQEIGIIQRPAYFKTLDQRNCRLGFHVECEKDSAYEGTGA